MFLPPPLSLGRKGGRRNNFSVGGGEETLLLMTKKRERSNFLLLLLLSPSPAAILQWAKKRGGRGEAKGGGGGGGGALVCYLFWPRARREVLECHSYSRRRRSDCSFCVLYIRKAKSLVNYCNELGIFSSCFFFPLRPPRDVLGIRTPPPPPLSPLDSLKLFSFLPPSSLLFRLSLSFGRSPLRCKLRFSPTNFPRPSVSLLLSPFSILFFPGNRLLYQSSAFSIPPTYLWIPHFLLPG